MNSKLWVPVGTAVCMLTLSLSCSAENRTDWGTPFVGGTPIDDSALMQVSARGMDDDAVKQLQHNGKLVENAAHTGLVQSMLGATAAESAEKQAVQTQFKMAMLATQTVSSTVQLTGVVAAVTMPINAVIPALTMPMFGMPMLPSK